MLELAPWRLFNFFSREGGSNSKGALIWRGRLFRFTNFSLNMTLSLFQVNTNCNMKWQNCNERFSGNTNPCACSLRGRRTKGREGGTWMRALQQLPPLCTPATPTIALRARIQLPPSLPFVRRPRQRSRFALAFNFPPPSPLYAGHVGYVRGTYVPFTFNALLSLSSVNLTNNSLQFLYRSPQISRGTSYALIYGYFP